MNILIIDDERLVLETVYDQVTGLGLTGIEAVDTAGSAEAARERMRERHYEIFLCDIVMPREDGIEFARWVLESMPESKFIFLTAHADFRYMKEAIAMNSFDYLLKPTRSGELKEVLERAAAQIQVELRNRQRLTRAIVFEENERAVNYGMVSSYLDGQEDCGGFVEKLLRRRALPERHRDEQSALFVFPAYVQVLGKAGSMTGQNLSRAAGDQTNGMALSGAAAGADRQAAAEEQAELQTTCVNIISETFDAREVGAYVHLEEERSFMVFLVSLAPEAFGEQPEKRWETFRILLEKLLFLETAVYIGEAGELSSLCGCREEFLYRRENNRRRQPGVFIRQNSRQAVGLRERARLWQKLLDDREYSRFVESLTGTILFDSSSGSITKEYLLQLHEYVTEILLNYMVSQKIDSKTVFDDGLSYIDYMNSYSSVDQFTGAVEYVVGRLGKEKTELIDATEAAKAYIADNLFRDISVTDVAEVIGLNPEHLTRVFRKKTGRNLKEYIINEKIESAKHLLSATPLPVTIIASRVGYGSYSNFIRTFRQIVGMTPLEYRRKEQGVIGAEPEQ